MTVASVRNGAIAAVTMALFYVAVVRGASGSWTHLAGIVINAAAVLVAARSLRRQRARLRAMV